MPKLTANLLIETVQQLRWMARKRGVTMTRVIHDAIVTESFVDGAVRAGGKILVETNDGRMLQVIWPSHGKQL